MQDEIVDIVDIRNVVLTQTPKRVAHQEGLLHRTVIAHVRDSAGRWLLVKQSADRQDAGQYVLPVGGHVRAGEAEEDAIRREAEEEIGLKDFEHKFIGRTIYNRDVLGRHENHYFTLFEVVSDETPVLGDEAVEYRHFTEAELIQELQLCPELFGDSFFATVREFYPHIF